MINSFPPLNIFNLTAGEYNCQHFQQLCCHLTPPGTCQNNYNHSRHQRAVTLGHKASLGALIKFRLCGVEPWCSLSFLSICLLVCVTIYPPINLLIRLSISSSSDFFVSAAPMIISFLIHTVFFNRSFLLPSSLFCSSYLCPSSPSYTFRHSPRPSVRHRPPPTGNSLTNPLT